MAHGNSQTSATPGYSAAINPTTTTTIVVLQPNCQQLLGPNPSVVTCPYCHTSTLTRIRRKPSRNTHLCALLMCVLQLYCCVWAPYCIAGCMATSHKCGMCNRYIGTYCP